MLNLKRSWLWQRLSQRLKKRYASNLIPAIRHRLFRIERLEDRALLATITWGNAAGGNWNVPSNWVGGVVPAANDDVVIPDLVGTPTITFNTGTIAVRSLSIRENFVLAGGTFSATTISQLAGSFDISDGT